MEQWLSCSAHRIWWSDLFSVPAEIRRHGCWSRNITESVTATFGRNRKYAVTDTAIETNVRPNFGFAFGAEKVDFNTFGILSVSAESSRDTIGNISASAAVTPNFGGHRKQVRSPDTVSTAAKSLLHSLITRPRSWRRPSYRSC